MDQETTHTRIDRGTKERLNTLADKTGISRTRIVNDLLSACLDAIEEDSPDGQLQAVNNIRALLGQKPADVLGRLQQLETRIEEIAETAYKGRARK